MDTVEASGDVALIQTDTCCRTLLTFHRDLLDLFGLLIDPFLPSDLFCGTH